MGFAKNVNLITSGMEINVKHVLITVLNALKKLVVHNVRQVTLLVLVVYAFQLVEMVVNSQSSNVTMEI